MADKPLSYGWRSVPYEGQWTQADDYFILDNPDMTAQQVADALGRTKMAIETRRHRLQKVEPTNFAVRKGRQLGEPWEVGSRPLVCKTCPKCGKLLDASWFHRNAGTDGARRWRHECRGCGSERWAQATDSQKAQRERTKRLQEITADKATRVGQEYTETDLQILGDERLSIFQMALATGRTLQGVMSSRQRYGFPARNVRLGDPSEAEWIIRRAA